MASLSRNNFPVTLNNPQTSVWAVFIIKTLSVTKWENTVCFLFIVYLGEQTPITDTYFQETTAQNKVLIWCSLDTWEKATNKKCITCLVEFPPTLKLKSRLYPVAACLRGSSQKSLLESQYWIVHGTGRLRTKKHTMHWLILNTINKTQTVMMWICLYLTLGF